MTQTARLYGGSLYDLAAEEQLTDTIMEQMETVRNLFLENPDYVELLMEPSIPQEERNGLIEKAFGAGAERYCGSSPDVVKNSHGVIMWITILRKQ